MTTPLITVEQLQNICSQIPEETAIKVTDAINKVCPLYGMNTDILHEFLANVIHESAEFTRYEENLNYSAARVMEVWPSRFKTLADAEQYARKPEKLACKVYNGRLGNFHPMDGWDFRGAGPIQITGRENFTRFAFWMGLEFQIFKAAQEWARILRTDHEFGMHSACWVFSVYMDLNDEAEEDEMRTIIKRINGGYTGESERNKYYRLCKQILK
ncbi:glycoside hydrolase family 19 protein [Pseudobacter ginsenosidimutans]|uniref:Putative chitinase n=1 Tax=Pseudobacter ginsenosidimutans TaxID=661488 RepID=A0A4V2F084_9BACT|nr:glycoside hydrolase family 19 protein [Pseudobacter ginsenosidimutans]QEC40297.1 glycoside hydrolase family 19 protein [Pseudobacter ginsenosidimutans]RZS69100.1 putative chitinase [Pseudobacter ginsenosidimutans]